MTRPRSILVSVEDTPYYHVVSRCVRRSFLCGFDRQTQTDYEHRRGWIENRIRILSGIFSVGICAYAVMSNHYHIVVKLNPDKAEAWSSQEVIQRWLSLFKGPLLIQRLQQGEKLSTAELETIDDIVEVWRKRLADLGWFMKCLNEPIAREANREDKCTGHFFEARYKSQALKTEQALLSCMAYVDLNPIRAKMAQTPETSAYTSIKERVESVFNLADAIKEGVSQGYLNNTAHLTEVPMVSFSGATRDEAQQGIPFDFIDYLELVDQTGRVVREDKRGFISSNQPKILERLTISIDDWLYYSQNFEAAYRRRRLLG